MPLPIRRQYTPQSGSPSTNDSGQPLTNVSVQPLTNETSQPRTGGVVHPTTNGTSQPLTNGTVQSLTNRTAQSLINGLNPPMTSGSNQSMANGLHNSTTNGISHSSIHYLLANLAQPDRRAQFMSVVVQHTLIRHIIAGSRALWSAVYPDSPTWDVVLATTQSGTPGPAAMFASVIVYVPPFNEGRWAEVTRGDPKTDTHAALVDLLNKLRFRIGTELNRPERQP